MRVALASLLATRALGGAPGECVAPAVCSPPEAKYSVVKLVQSRQQWIDSGGYCGALSVQAIAMSYGAYISQDQVRRVVTPGIIGQKGQMIMHYNIVQAMDKLKLTHSDWDWKGESTPQSEKYLVWLKKQLASGHPVVWMITTKEIGAVGLETQGIPLYTHIEPVWGLYSNHSLDDPTVYPEDVLVHGADYGAEGAIEGPALYRRFDSLVDNVLMTGNCSKAQAGMGKNEYYPCIMRDVGIGYAITGVVEPESASIPVSLAIDRFDEPDFPWKSDKPCDLHGTVTVNGVEAGKQYTLLRWDDYRKVPTDGSYLKSDFDHTYTFTAEGNNHVFVDPVSFSSQGATYYRCVEAAAVQV